MDGLRIAAELMAVAARTAPKTKGEDYIEIKIIEGEQLRLLAEDMYSFQAESGKTNFDRDGKNVAASGSLLLLAVKDAPAAGLNCGACGRDRCADLPPLRAGAEFDGPLCVWRLLDLGIAAGSAVKTAGLLNIDNRIMYRAGVCAKRLGLIQGQAVLGIPLSVSGKNIYFDR